jgi:hypothetical protein
MESQGCFVRTEVRQSACAFLLVLLCSAVLFGQGAAGVILGTVSDPSGAVLPKTPIVATNTLTNETRTAVSDADGNYLIPALPVGPYRVEVALSGFKRYIRDGIQVDANRNARVDVTLEIGGVSDQVQVTSDAPLVDTYQVQAGAQIDSRRAVDLPLSGRNVYALATTLPGVTAATAQTVYNRDGNRLRVNGSRTADSSFLLDGGMNNSHFRNSGSASPNPDAVQEVQVITSNFNAEYGRSAGAVVNVVTRSGGNQLHGSLWEFLRNDKLNARSFFQSTVSPLKQNQFGGSLGGPIRRNRTFFFGTYEGLRIRSNQFQNGARTATAAERAGDFSSATGNARPTDPLTGQRFPDGIIPKSRLDPVATAILAKWVPAPNTPDGRLESRMPSNSLQNQYLAKIDHLLGSAHRISGTLFYVNSAQDIPFSQSNIPGYSYYKTTYNQQNVVVADTWTISPTLLSEARFTFGRIKHIQAAQNTDSLATFGSKATMGSDLQTPYPARFVISGRWNMGFENNVYPGQMDNTYAFSDTLTWMRGSHSVKFGSWFAWEGYNLTNSLSGAGVATVNGTATGNSMADFMLGRAASFRQTSGSFREYRKWDWQSFVQDDWKISRRLTLNLGVRYELYPWFHNRPNDLSTYSPGARSTRFPTAPVGLLFNGDPGVPSAIARTDRNNIAPRVGLVFDPFGDGKTAIRAGFGVFYSTPVADNSTYLQNQPFVVDYTVYGVTSFVDPYASVSGGPFPYKLDPQNPRFSYPLLTGYVDPNIATPYVQQYSLTLQRQVLKDLSLQVGYVGKGSRNLLLHRDANLPVYTAGQSTIGNVNARRPIQPGVYGQITMIETASNANYHSLQFMADRRFSRGVSIQFNYTFSKSIDEVSDDPSNPVELSLVNANSRRYDHAASGLDIRHIANISYLWQMPAFESLGRIGRSVLGNWAFNGLMRIQSGDTVNITAGTDTNLDGNSGDRPDVNGKLVVNSSGSRDEQMRQYFNTSIFSLPRAGTYGSAGRNLLHAPGSFGWDASLAKSIPTRERQQLQLRLEAFGVLNHMNPGAPVAVLSNASFGRIINGSGGRVFQVGMKYVF